MKAWSGILLFPFLLFTGCEESQYAISAVIDGQLWESNQYASARITDDDVLVMNGFHRTYLPVSLAIRDYQYPGEYPLDSLNNAFLFGQNVNTGYFTRMSDPGLITITSFQPSGNKGGSITGTFQVTLYNHDGNSLVVKDGKFDIVISE